MQRGTVAPPDPGSTAIWAEKSRRRHHPSGGDPDRFTTWRTGSDARLRELLALPMDIAAGTDERLIIDGPEAAEIGAAEDSAAGDRAAEDGAATGTGGDETVRLITLTTGGAEIPCWLLTPPTARRR